MSGLIDDIELYTTRKVSIICDEDEAFGRFKGQEQSLLFSLLPRELWQEIWAYALAPFEDQARPFAETDYYYRPGRIARLKTDTAVLHTCRRIWLEANDLPMLQAQHLFYYHRATPDARNAQWLSSLTGNNRWNFGHVHLLVQMYIIERLASLPGELRCFFTRDQAPPGNFQPRMFHVTLRHTDWLSWEDEAELHLDDRWLQAILDSPDLRSTETFKLELETVDYKYDQLEPILRRLRLMESEERETHIIDGKPTTTKFLLSEQESRYEWEGPTTVNDVMLSPYVGKDCLRYIVTTLTWKLRSPDYPRAVIPRIRRERRVPEPVKDTSNFALDACWIKHTTDLAYADMSGHDNSMCNWRKRDLARQQREEKAGRSPTPVDAQMTVLMIKTSRAVRFISRVQAIDVEEKRRHEFRRLMGFRQADRCDKERSLLKFTGGRLVNDYQGPFLKSESLLYSVTIATINLFFREPRIYACCLYLFVVVIEYGCTYSLLLYCRSTPIKNYSSA